jgi:hypothetical protein
MAVFFNCSTDGNNDNLCDCTTKKFRKVTSSTSLIEDWNLNDINDFRGDCNRDGTTEEYQEEVAGFNYFYIKETECN